MIDLRSEPAGSDRPRTAEPDEALVARACDGDAAAFETIMRRHNRLLFRTARGIAGDDDEAQDIVQQTYLQAFSRLGSYRGDAALGTWLARIAINAALDAQRKRGRTVELDAFSEAEGEALPEPLMSLRTDETDTPDGIAERTQVRALLQAHAMEA